MVLVVAEDERGGDYGAQAPGAAAVATLAVKGDEGKRLLRGMIAWAHRCKIPEFVKLAKTLSRYRPTIDNTLDHAVSNGRAEALNAQVNALITRARGFRTADALIAAVHFNHGGLCPQTPWP